MRSRKSVIVVGGGLAGLTAADQILKYEPDAKVTVLEATSEVGGRTLSVMMNGVFYDLGAEWIGRPQKYVTELAERAGNQTMDQFHTGTKILELKKKLMPYRTNIPFNVGVIPLLNLQWAMWQIDRMAKKVPLDDPRSCPQAVAWDSITVHTWIMQNVWFESVKKLMQLCVRSIIGCETNQVSFLFFLWYVHQNFGLDCLCNIENGLQDKKLKKGTQYLSYFLKEEIEKKKGRIVLDTYVSRIQHNADGVKVHAKNGLSYEADYLVMAMPPNTIKKVEFEPQLSRERRLICDRYCMGAYSKCILLYDKQYWRDLGLSGQVLTDGVDGPITMAYDDSRMREDGKVQPGIAVFVCGAIDEEWTGDKKMFERTVTEKLAQYYKCAEMLAPIEVTTKVWNEHDSLQGGPVCFTPPGVLTKISNLRRPEGRIHWAGTETALISQGYMDGAIQSGIRVSKQILQRLRSEEAPKQVPKQPTSAWYSKIVNSSQKWFQWW